MFRTICGIKFAAVNHFSVIPQLFIWRLSFVVVAANFGLSENDHLFHYYTLSGMSDLLLLLHSFFNPF